MDILKKIDWNKGNGLLPVITQDYKTLQVLMLGFMNKKALQQTLQCGKMVYYSRTRKTLWLKGETSGCFQLIKKIYLDCDIDTLLITVEQIGNVCHTGNKTCFFNQIQWKKQ